MTGIDFRRQAINGMAWRIAHENIGIYAKSVSGEGGYEQRTERMEGWNECRRAHSRKAAAISKWLKELSDEHKVNVEDLLLQNTIDLFIGEENSIHLTVNCNDLFFWGCSDAEDLELSELASLSEAMRDAKAAGSEHGGELLWVARKRGMRPQGAYYAHVSPSLAKLFDTCGEFREAEFGNPVASSFEAGEKYRRKCETSRE